MSRAPALRSALALAFTILGTAGASALSLPFEEHEYLPAEETITYVERSLNRQAPLTIEHPYDPAASRGDRAAVAGFCHSGGIVRRRDEFGQPVIARQREVCENVAPRQLWPGRVDPRPVWPNRPAARQRVLATKG